MTSPHLRPALLLLPFALFACGDEATDGESTQSSDNVVEPPCTADMACKSGDECCPEGCDSVTDCDCPSMTHEMPVLVLRYFPEKNGALDPEVTGLSTPLTDLRSKIDKLNQDIMNVLEDGARYHGYKDASATSAFDYSIVSDKEYLEALPISNCVVYWDGFHHYPDFDKLMQRENICDWVENKGVKEVWLWAYHHGDVVPAESKMAGPHGNTSNSQSVCWNLVTPNMPTCSKTYVVYMYNYGRGTDCAQENHTHHLEAVLKRLDHGLFWNNFVQPYGKEDSVNACGWTHYPPNGKQDYDWQNPLVVKSDCEDWTPDGSGEDKEVSCDTWGDCSVNDGGLSFKRWWMQNIPGKDNNLPYKGKKLRNWWDAMGDFDRTIESKSGLVCP